MQNDQQSHRTNGYISKSQQQKQYIISVHTGKQINHYESINLTAIAVFEYILYQYNL